VNELLPIAGGLLGGALVARLRPSRRLPAGAALAVALGVVATVVSGELAISWAFLLVDVGGTGVAVSTGYALARYAQARSRGSRREA